LDDVDELRRVNENFGNEVKEGQIKKQELDKMRLDLQKEKADLVKSGNKLAEEYGKFRSAGEQFAILKTSRDNHIISIAESYHIEGYTEGPFSDAIVEAFIEQTSVLSKKAQESLVTIQEENKKKYNEKGQKIESIRREFNDVVDKMNSMARTMEKNKEEITKIKNTIKEKKSMHSKMLDLEAQLKSRQEKVLQLKSGFNPEAIKEQMKQLENQKKKKKERRKN